MYTLYKSTTDKFNFNWIKFHLYLILWRIYCERIQFLIFFLVYKRTYYSLITLIIFKLTDRPHQDTRTCNNRVHFFHDPKNQKVDREMAPTIKITHLGRDISSTIDYTRAYVWSEVLFDLNSKNNKFTCKGIFGPRHIFQN